MPFDDEGLVVRRRDDNTWTVVEELVYRGRRDVFVVPAGFPTDFASVPRVVVWLVPRFGRYTLAAILHDWLCRDGIGAGLVSPRDADGLFRRAMRELGVPVVRRWLMWTGVRWGALTDPPRRAGWILSAPGVLVITALAAPVVVPPAVLVALALTVYGFVEGIVSAPIRERPTDAGSAST
jgi:hypothetical protein